MPSSPFLTAFLALALDKQARFGVRHAKLVAVSETLCPARLIRASVPCLQEISSQKPPLCCVLVTGSLSRSRVVEKSSLSLDFEGLVDHPSYC